MLADDGLAVYKDANGKYVGYCGNNTIKMWDSTFKLLSIYTKKKQKINKFTEKNVMSTNMQYKPVYIDRLFILSRSTNFHIFIEHIEGLLKTIMLRRYLVGTQWLNYYINSNNDMKYTIQNYCDSLQMYKLYYCDFNISSKDIILDKIKLSIDSTLMDIC